MDNEVLVLRFIEVERPEQPDDNFGANEPAYDESDTGKYEEEFELNNEDFDFDFACMIRTIEGRLGNNWEASSSHFDELSAADTWISGSNQDIYTGIMTEYSVHYVKGSIEIWHKVLKHFQ